MLAYRQVLREQRQIVRMDMVSDHCIPRTQSNLSKGAGVAIGELGDSGSPHARWDHEFESRRGASK
jgi:hypothetical protein